MAETDVRRYAVQARSTDVFGRVLCNSRNHHYVVDGPVQNGCPGEAITPAELFLAGVASCGVELVQSLAKGQNLPLTTVDVSVSGTIDRSRPVRQDLSLFNAVRIEFRLGGVAPEQANQLMEGFKAR